MTTTALVARTQRRHEFLSLTTQARQQQEQESRKDRRTVFAHFLKVAEDLYHALDDARGMEERPIEERKAVRERFFMARDQIAHAQAELELVANEATARGTDGFLAALLSEDGSFVARRILLIELMRIELDPVLSNGERMAAQKNVAEKIRAENVRHSLGDGERSGLVENLRQP